MAFDRIKDPRGAGAVVAAAGLATSGAVTVWALRQGFYGTSLLAGLLGLWLTAILWWRASDQCDAPPASTIAAAEDDLIAADVA
jgi:hypothetical protein